MATKPARKKPAAARSGGKRVAKKLITPMFRLSFPAVFEARAMEEGQEPKFSLSAIWTPETFTAKDKERWRLMLKEREAASMEMFGKPVKNLPSTYKKGIRNGNEREDMDGYGEGTRFANLTSKNKPGVIDREKNEISKEEGNTDEIYPGCYCRATVVCYAYDVSGGRGVAFGLRNLQKIKDGPRLDNRANAEEDFDDDELDEEYFDGEDMDDADDGDEDEDEFE